MTMQRILNYGSSLQAFALRTLLTELSPEAQVDYLDYRPGKPLIHESTGHRTQGQVGRLLGKLREYSAIDARVVDVLRFMNHKRNYAKKYFPLISLKPETNQNFAVDLQVIGSDEVFNCVQANANVGYAKDLFGIDSSARSLISYAGSFGNTTLKKIRSHGLEQELASAFAQFDHISVRDTNSAQIVQELTGIAPPIHLDPTLIIDLSTWADIPSLPIASDPYLLVYAYPGRLTREENDHIRAYAKKQGLKVLCFGGAQSCGDMFVDCSPFELLGYFQQATAVVTDTFHGTIFSVISKRSFATITRSSQGHGYGNIEKLGYLLNVLGLPQRELITIHDLEMVLEPEIDYHSVGEIIAFEKQRSCDYLTNAVKPLNDLNTHS
ncbi:polysaccharide pyruvyl transferase family protein [Glutamicibacter uratoxydans]|uniref:polysaccharide pyruvyl transferase family protein n=1 Tax=Glutamicibacter uratoxydans TaxID=43667 RepID=UPI003D6EDE80